MRKVNRNRFLFGGGFVLLVISLVSWMMLRDDPIPKIERTLIYDFSVKNPTGRVVHQADLWVSIPVIDDKAEIVKLESSHSYKIERDIQGNQRVIFQLKGIAPYSNEFISLNIKLLLQQRASQNKAQDMQSFVTAEPLIESSDADVIDLAGQLSKDENYQTANAIYEWVADNIRYAGFIKNDHGARYALEHKTGDCTEYALLTTALARASGLPARAVGGFVLGKGFKLSSSGYHNWSEIWIDDRWVLVDSQNRVFDKGYDRYIAMNLLDSQRKSQQFYNIEAPLVAKMN